MNTSLSTHLNGLLSIFKLDYDIFLRAYFFNANFSSYFGHKEGNMLRCLCTHLSIFIQELT